MPNYNESTIYKLCCKDTTIEEIYIGSTINFGRRKSKHKQDCNDINKRGYNYKVYQFIRDNGGWDNWDMILIAKVNCNDRLELRKKEREFMEEYKPSLNMVIAQQTKIERKEYCKKNSKEYYKTNKEKLSIRNKEHYKTNREERIEKQKKYRETNKEEIREKAKVKITCECGTILAKGNLPHHRKTKKHINFINNT